MKKVILSFAMIFALGVASISAQVDNKPETKKACCKGKTPSTCYKQKKDEKKSECSTANECSKAKHDCCKEKKETKTNKAKN